MTFSILRFRAFCLWSPRQFGELSMKNNLVNLPLSVFGSSLIGCDANVQNDQFSNPNRWLFGTPGPSLLKYRMFSEKSIFFP